MKMPLIGKKNNLYRLIFKILKTLILLLLLISYLITDEKVKENIQEKFSEQIQEKVNEKNLEKSHGTTREITNNLSSFEIPNSKDSKEFVNNLNKYSIYRKPKYILLFDYINSPVCADFNAYAIFQYYHQHGNNDAYYILNQDTELYKSLVKNNQTMNIIPYKRGRSYNRLFLYMLNAKILIQSYAIFEFQKIASKVNYLKFLYICHAVNYFKINVIQKQLKHLKKRKINIILASPYEYHLYRKLNLYKKRNMYQGGLARYDRFEYEHKNESEKQCILISFTYRAYNTSIYEDSLFKKNIYSLLANENLTSYLEEKNIDLFVIQHHHDVRRQRSLDKKLFPKVKFLQQKDLAHYIVQCSLYITDFSSISFDFMFQNKPVLFYHIDKKDKYDFTEKTYMRIDEKNSIYYDNVFSEEKPLVNKLIYYVDRNFSLNRGLKRKYKTLFYNRKNITGKIIEVINKISE